MEQSLKLKLLRKLFSKEGEEGFSLIELVVVVAVLSALSAIAIPRFNCIQRKAKASTALSAMRQIQTECAVKKASTGISGTFSTGDLNSYQIQSDGSNSCSGAQTTGVISAIPNNTSQLPTFLLATSNNELTYSFRGQTGTNFTDCLGLLCQTFRGNGALAKVIEADFTYPDTYIERGCSAYFLVDGPTWENAENNAQNIGGNLISINDWDEHSWLASEFSKDKYSYSGDTNPGDPDEWINLWIGGEFNEQSDSWEWTSNDEWGENGFQGVGENDPGIGTGVGTDNGNNAIHNKLMAHFNHNRNENEHTRHGDGPGTYYWSANNGTSNNTRGIAEVSICD